MDFDELLAKVLPIFPDALFSEGHEGEVVIATGLRLNNGQLERISE
jgi:hypothetical protein